MKLKKSKFAYDLVGIAAPAGYRFLKRNDICLPKYDLWWVEQLIDIKDYTEPCIHPANKVYPYNYPITHANASRCGYIRKRNEEPQI